MANLIEYIQGQIYENSTEDITGSIMQQVLTRMVSDEGVINVHTVSGQSPFAVYSNAQAARGAVPDGFKKLGLVITYKLAGGWFVDEYVGTATSGWSTASNWKCLGPISVSQNAQTGKTTITIGSESFDVATQPVSVSQNTETGHTEISVGNVITPVASVEDIYKLSRNKVTSHIGKNLYNEETDEVGYLKSDGTTSSSSSYSITDFINVDVFSKVSATRNGNDKISTTGTFMCFYDSDKEFLSSLAGDSTSFDVPSGAKYARFSIYNTFKDKIQIESGASRTSYEPYNPIYGYNEPIYTQLKSIAFASDNLLINKRIKELFVLGLDSTKDYYVKTSYSGGVITIDIRENESDNALARYTGNVKQGIVHLIHLLAYDVQGWAYIDFTDESTDVVRSGNLNKTICSELSFSEHIKESIGYNYWKGLAANENRYLKINGEEANLSGFKFSDYIPIKRDTINLYHIAGGNASVYCCLVFYDYNKSIISVYNPQAGGRVDVTLTTSDIPTNAAYIRVNALIDAVPFISFTQNETAIIEKLNGVRIYDSQLNTIRKKGAISSLEVSGNVAQNSYLITAPQHIYPAGCISAHISGTISDILLGYGYNGSNYEHYAFYIQLTSTQVLVYYHEHATPIKETLTHGLTLDNETDISIVQPNERDWSNKAKLTITTSKGDVYTHTLLCWFGSGCGFVKNNGSTTISANIRVFARTLAEKIWMFGDSYFALWSDKMWPYYLFGDGYKNMLLNHLSGQNPSNALIDLQNLLTTNHIPQMIVWCQGMNGAADTIVDGNYVINPTKKDIIDWLKAYCENNGVTLILATIPSTPTLLHEGLNNYIRSLGVRYIDFAEAVGAQPDGTWTEGLCLDGTHPTEAGAKVLYARALSDCPELMTL